MSSIQLFSKFCQFIDERIFSEDNIGSSVAFVVDKALINEFCKRNGVDEHELMHAVRYNLYLYSRNITHIKGILAIQLYAASKRANSGGITVKNYRDRLSQVLLDWDMNDLQRWMEDHQELYWETFYDWCDSHFFFVAKCKRKTGAGRYVQYPIMQSQCVFTEEDLKYIACAFVDYDLLPGEDISETDFWRILDRYSLISYFKTRHSHEVRDNSRSDEDYKRQIFNYYLRWDGEYKLGYNSAVKRQTAKEADEFIYLTDDFSKLQFRNSNLKLTKEIDVSKLTYSHISRLFSFKHKGLILFKKDDIYDNYWQECRYLDENDEEDIKEEGIALVFTNQCNHRIIYKSELLIKRYANISIYRVKYSYSTSDLYAEKRFYSLEGGLKIGRYSYLLGAGPSLVVTRKSRFWIDGKPNDASKDETFDLSGLDTGTHSIRFPNYKRIEFEIVRHDALHPQWLDSYNKWNIDLEGSLWESVNIDNGIVGLDYTSIPQNIQSGLKGSVLNRWGMMHVFGTIQQNETNNVIKVFSKI
jgi:hypothetical protein